MRPNGQALLGSRGIFETKPHRKAFPGGRQVQGKTRVRSPFVHCCAIPCRAADRNEGQTKPESQAAPTQRTVDQCLSQTTRELVTII
jgi:hypothetical protein